MTAGRCDDPNCTCRSDELRWFTNQVLRRDAAKTDYIVIPLIGGVLARCFLARDGADREAEWHQRYHGLRVALNEFDPPDEKAPALGCIQ